MMITMVRFLNDLTGRATLFF